MSDLSRDSLIAVTKGWLDDMANIIKRKNDLPMGIGLGTNDMLVQAELIGGLPSIIEAIHEEEQYIDTAVPYNRTDFVWQHNSGFVPDLIIAQRTSSITMVNDLYRFIQRNGDARYLATMWNGTVFSNINTNNPSTLPIDENVWGYQPYNNGSGRIYAPATFRIVTIKLKKF